MSRTSQPSILTRRPSSVSDARPSKPATSTIRPNGSLTGRSSACWRLLYSYSGETVVRGFLRGGSWSNGGSAGVLTLNLYSVPSSPYANVGFRVSR